MKGKKTGGRQKGQINAVTRDVRAAMASFAEDFAPKFAGWVERVAITDPHKAGELYLKAIEYHVPKLSRAEVTGPGGAALTVTVRKFSGD